MASTFATLNILLTGNATGAVTALNQVQQKVQLVEKTAIAATIGLTALGQGIKQIGQAGTEFAGNFINAAVEWNHRLMELQNNTGVTTQVLGEMNAGIMEIASRSNASFPELTEGMEKIRDHGFSAADSITILDRAMKAASTTGEGTGSVAALIANTLHQYKLEASEAAHVTDVLMLSAQRTNATFAEFAENANVVLALGANLGVNYTEVAGALSALEKNGFGASEAQTQVKNMLTHIIHPAAEARDELEKLTKATGVDLTNAFTATGLESLGLKGVIDKLREAYKSMGYSNAGATEETMRLLNAQRGGIGTAVLSGKAYNDFVNILNDYDKVLNDELSPTEIAYQNALKDTGFQLGILGNMWTILMQSLGQTVMPMFNLIIKTVQDAIKVFLNLPESVKQIIAYFVIFGSATMVVVGSLLIFVALLPLISNGLALLASPLGVIVGGITLLGLAVAVLGVMFVTNFNNMQTIVMTVIDGVILPALQRLSEWFTAVWPTIAGILQYVFFAIIMPAFTFIANIIFTYLIPAFMALGNVVLVVMNAALPVIALFWNVFLMVATNVVSAIYNVIVPAFVIMANWISQNMTTVQIALGILAVMFLYTFVPAVWAGVMAGVAFIISWLPVITFIALLVGTVYWLVNQWNQGFFGMRQTIEAVGSVIGSWLQAIWGWITGLWTKLVEFWNWVTGNAMKAGQATGDQYMEGMNNSVASGNDTLAQNIQGVGQNLGVLQAPAGTLGWNIGNNWITNVNDSVAAGITTLSANINTVKNMLTTMDAAVAAGKEVQGPLKPGQTQEDLYKSQREAFQKQLDQDYRGIYYQASRAANTPSSAAGIDLDLFKGITLDAGTGPDWSDFMENGFDGGNGPAPLGGKDGAGGGKGGGRTKSAIEEAADQVKNIADAIKAGIQAFGMLSSLHVPENLDAKILEFANASNKIMMAMQAVALHFSPENLELISKFSDAAKSAFGMLTEAFKFFDLLSQSASRVLNPMNNLVGWSLQMLTKIVIIMNSLGAMIPMWDLVASQQVGAFAEAAGKVFDAFTKAFDFMEKIATKGPGILGGTTAIAFWSVQLAEKVVIIMNELGRMIPLWDEFASTRVGQFADAAGKVFDAFTKAFDFFEKIQQKGISVLASTTAIAYWSVQLAQKVVIIMNELGKMIQDWTDPNWATQISAFADASGKVFDSFLKAFDFFERLSQSGIAILTGPVPLAYWSVQLAEKIKIIMNELGKAIIDWKDPNWITQVSGFADATGKVFDSFMKALDFFVKLVDAGIRILNSGIDLEKYSGDLVIKIKNIMNAFGAAIKDWTDPNWSKQVVDFAGASSAVLGAMTDAMDLFQAIAENSELLSNHATDIDTWITTLGDKIVTITENIKDKLGAWTDPAVAARVKAFGEAAKPIMDTLISVLTLFVNSQDANLSQGAIQAFALLMMDLGGASVSIANSVEIATRLWTETVSKRVSEFAKAAGEVVKTVTATFDLLLKLSEGGAILKDRPRLTGWAMDLAGSTVSIADAMEIVTPRWTTTLSERVGAFAEAAGNVVGTLLATFELLSKLGSDIKAPDSSKVSNLISTTISIMTQFRDGLILEFQKITKDVVDEQKRIGDIADSIGKVLSVLGSTIDLINSFAENQGALAAADPLAGLDVVIESIKTAVAKFTANLPVIEANAVTAAESAQKIVSLLNDSVTLLASLADAKMPSIFKIDLFFQRFALVMSRLPEAMSSISADTAAAAKEFGEKLSPAIKLLVDTVGLFKAITGERDEDGNIKGGMMDVDPDAIGALTGKLWLLLERLRTDLLEKIAPATLQLAKDFGEKVGPAISVLKDTLDLFKGLVPDEEGKGGFVAPDPANIEGLVGSLYTMLHHWNNLIIGGEFQGDFQSRSDAFAAMVGQVLASIQEIVDLVKSVDEVGGVDKIMETMDKLKIALQSTTDTTLPGITTGFGTMFGDINKEIERQTQGKSPDTVGYLWAGKDLQKSFLWKLQMSFIGQAGARWEIPIAFNAMFVDIDNKFTIWGPIITGFWKTSILDVMVENTKTAVAAMLAEFAKLQTPLDPTKTKDDSGNPPFVWNPPTGKFKNPTEGIPPMYIPPVTQGGDTYHQTYIDGILIEDPDLGRLLVKVQQRKNSRNPSTRK